MTRCHGRPYALIAPAYRQFPFLRLQALPEHNVMHAVRLASPAEAHTQFASGLAEAYRVGAQEHLRR